MSLTKTFIALLLFSTSIMHYSQCAVFVHFCYNVILCLVRIGCQSTRSVNFFIVLYNMFAIINVSRLLQPNVSLIVADYLYISLLQSVNCNLISACEEMM